MIAGKGAPDRALTEEQVREIIAQGIPVSAVEGKRVLTLTPDATRTCPLPMMVRALLEHVAPHAECLDFMAALGTHQPLSDDELLGLYGLDKAEKAATWPEVKLLNHRWDLDGVLTKVGRISSAKVAEITGGLFHEGVDVVINKAVHDYDLILILGPVFPHEVAGFSGGNKYLFPGIAGGDFLHFTHWLGAVVTCWDTIGIRRTPVRACIDHAASLVPTPRLTLSMVVKSKTELAGLYVGETDASWSAATELSAQMHIVFKDKPFHTVLGTAAPMYNELWVAGKVMYKLEPVVADGGTLIIYGEHIDRVSDTWGEQIEKIGYHTRDYFLKRMDQFRSIPGGVLAHSTHVRGLGEFDDGVEKPRIDIVLATSIPPDVCERINMGYMDPKSIDIESYRGREQDGVLLVENAGEVLHRLKPTA